ncbi:MAG: alpha/beta hydrolase [Actinomycetota bacterium]|nr:alpha/beta hydrolase [Actinomycetota bacterium]
MPSSETPVPATLSLDLPHGLHVEALTWGPDDGPLAVLLHGFPDTAHTWRHLGPALAQDGWRVVAPFLRGYAPAGLAPDGSYHVPALCQDAITLHAALGGDGRAVLVGHDWGAITANGVGASDASPYSAIVSMAVPPVPALVPQGAGDAGLVAQQALMSWYTLFHQLPLLPERVFSRHVARLWRSWSPGYDPGEDLELLAAALPDRVHRKAAIDYYRAAPRRGRLPATYAHLADAWLGMPTVPMLHLHGARDGCLSARFATRLAEIAPSTCRVEVVPSAGHFLQLERPDRVNALVRGFLAQVS